MARNRHPEATVERILTEAARLFLQKGFEKTSMQDIMDATGLSKGAIYHHFASKEDILLRIGERMGEENAARQIGVGVPTLQDVVQELVKPGRDVRDDLPAPILRTDVLDIKDLKPGMELTGTVRNVVDFGVFVDIGVHQDGLVHISQICDRFIKHPSQAVAVGDVVKVVVLEVDEKKHRISLSMRQAAGKK